MISILDGQKLVMVSTCKPMKAIYVDTIPRVGNNKKIANKETVSFSELTKTG